MAFSVCIFVYFVSHCILKWANFNKSFIRKILPILDVSQYFYDISQHVKEDWYKLAEKLGVSKDDIQRIERNNIQTFDRAFECLELWQSTLREKATKYQLKGALKAIKIKRDDIAKIFDT